ncbi:hypothetical protein ASPFODRAFT_49349 [Aspergillus luchuensis CBS 106.47]|uniref:Uncharacterized protein n=1 Tax=Aspergillus luchuensis (strain CBS 106.47) TaxID=1137211 RepID=A0A1M3TAU7_ASPLC|nr:hypothetical protein ASPFODRAFT_49349 [Aspergillus luchuensis CBS 106.47]
MFQDLELIFFCYLFHLSATGCDPNFAVRLVAGLRPLVWITLVSPVRAIDWVAVSDILWLKIRVSPSALFVPY